ncbi:MAG: ATP-binding protein [Saprospiraceae bacterium]
MIQRSIAALLKERLQKGDKIVIIYGPRQVGKTTLARTVIADLEGRKLEINADQSQFNEALSSRNLTKLRQLADGYDILFIDEAQRIPEIGLNLKILHDELPDLKVLATGSSSFDLASKIREPLTGRTWSHTLFPIAVCELAADLNRFELDALLEDLLVFGAYPAIFSQTNRLDKIEYLQEIARSYLFKDILEMGGIKFAPKLRDLVRLLAYKIGQEVSVNEISNALKTSRGTIDGYIDLLEKSFVVFRVGGYNRNMRKEVTRHDKIYFYDLGIRNAMIENFLPIANRNDGGQLWENFLLLERMKSRAYLRQRANTYFWRTTTGAELDLVEEANDQLYGFEFKFSQKTVNAPKSFIETYPNSSFKTINRDNYLDFLLEVV